MKHVKFTIAAAALLAFSATTIAQTKVIIREKPVTLIQQGAVWMVPEGSASSYYYYTVGADQYICTVSEPTELAGIKFVSVNLKMGTDTKEVRCYPSTHFDLQ